MKFRTKIWMLPLSAATVFVLGVAVTFAVGSRTSSVLTRLNEVDNPYMEMGSRLDRNFEQVRLTLQAAVSESDAGKLKEIDPILTAAHAALNRIAQIEGKADEARELTSALDAFSASALGAVGAMLNKTPGADGPALVSKMQSTQAALEKLLSARLGDAKAAIGLDQQVAKDGVTLMLWVVAGTGLVVLAVLGAASLGIVRSVWKDLGGEPSELRDLVQRVADGDLSVRVEAPQSVPGSLQHAMGAMISHMRDTVELILRATDSISTASSEVATGSHDLSSRTEETSTNLQKTACSMDQLTCNVRQSADAASQANQLASAAAGAARRGGDVVAQVVLNMDEINVASRKISEISSVIDSIAFQTNILALNAAVEAARAGSEGRGFAVVASEVRTLAQRSAAAAKEIKTLINVASQKVVSGTSLVQETGNAMLEIVAGVQRVTDIIGEITLASAEQATGIGHVNQSVSQLDQMTQQNAALVEQSTAAAESLREQAGKLVDAVSVFHLEGDSGRSAPALPAERTLSAAPHDERRGPVRATNVTRAKFGTAARQEAKGPVPGGEVALANTGTDDEWLSF